MTAEVAILNKTAVALAADSAITLSAGADQHKIFDSADKLFELTQGNAIGIMINSDMSFMEAPLPVLIKEYRQSAPRFARVKDAGEHFLEYLDTFARHSPERIKIQALEAAATPIFESINDQARKSWLERIADEETGGLREEFRLTPDRVSEVAREEIERQLEILSQIVESLEPASFIGNGPVTLTANEQEVLSRIAPEALPTASDEQRERSIELARRAMLARGTGRSTTGIIVAGFGSDELFPTLVSFEVFGVVGDRLKYAETNYVDIDRDGHRARVIPFAQREMVERFLYGLDSTLKDQVIDFCKQAVPAISDEVINSLELTDADASALTSRAEEAEEAFYENLSTTAFEAIKRRSELEIDEMVEFMPKPEMARMAEALVNLTSIKRRVSRGFETVGGPIDVAIISKAEGFVWCARKHYFPPELNSRYFARIGPRE